MRHSPRSLHLRTLALVALVTLIQACGGGGGGGGSSGSGGSGGGGSTSTLRVALSTSSLSWAYFPDATPASQLAVAVVTGTYDGTIYVGAIVENNGTVNAIDPVIPLTISSDRATALLKPAAALPIGTYSGRILFLACSDSACNNRIGGTPLPLPFTVTVQTPVQTTPASITANAVSGSAFSQLIAVQPGVGESTFTAETTSSFIRIENRTANGFTLKLLSLPVGTYSGTINLAGDLGSHSMTAVSYTVAAPQGGQHGLSVAPGSLTFSTTEGAVSAAQPVVVTEPSWLPGLKPPVVRYAAGQTGDWLRVTPVPNGYSVSADAGAVSTGTYSAILDVQANSLPNGIADPFGVLPRESVNIALTVGAGLVRPADVLHIIDSEDTAAELTGNLRVNIAGGPPVTWNAVSSAPWLAVTPSGQTGTDLTYAVDAQWARSTAINFQDYPADITLSVPGSPITPAHFTVVVSPRFATVGGVGARLQLAGQGTRLVVTGKGFAALADPAARISIPNAAITAVERSSDQKLLVDVQALSVGTYSVLVGNALGATPTSESFRVITPVPAAYATAPTGHYLSTLFADDERGVLYGILIVGPTRTLYRFRPSGAAWTSDIVLPGADVTNAGLLSDGSLIATTSPGTIHILDGATLTETSQLTVPGGIGMPLWSDSGIPVGADGKAWLNLTPVCGSTFAKLGYYDPSDAGVHDVAVPGGSFCPFINGLDFSMARNGERLLISPLPSVNSLLYMDTSDRTVHQSSAPNVSWINSARSNDDGTRIVLDMVRVIDEQQSLVGKLVPPDYGSPGDYATSIAAAISPDGTRAYVLTYGYFDHAQAVQRNPRVHVFDTTAAVGDAALPVLGYFEIADYPSCYNAPLGCDITPPTAISMDGKTLYFGGSDRLVVTPIPQEVNLLH